MFGNEQDPFVGHLLADKYHVVGRIGRGGMGSVYQGLHVLMERRVAIKVVPTSLAKTDPARLSRFHLEAKAASLLRHSNIIAVHDFGITKNGMAYLVMDFVDGEGLDAVMKREKVLTEQRTLEIFAQVASGLAHAHENGIVHRDLKPSNIMIERDAEAHEHVTIVDFGIAKFLNGKVRSSHYRARDSQIVGSPLYMSPEHCTGDTNLDGRADVYSLGCLMYQALTGRPPFMERTLISVIQAHLYKPAPEFAIACPQLRISADVETIVLKALRKRPEDRQQSMREMEEELRRAANALKSRKKVAPLAVHDDAGTLLEKLARIEAGSSTTVPKPRDQEATRRAQSKTLEL